MNTITFVRLCSLQSIAESTQPQFSVPVTQPGTQALSRTKWKWFPDNVKYIILICLFFGEGMAASSSQKNMNILPLTALHSVQIQSWTFEVQAEFSCDQLHESSHLALVLQ